jgi:hypothetical protein
MTVLCTIVSKISEKEYKVKTEQSFFTAYSEDKEYNEG